MGGLKQPLRKTYLRFLAGGLALSGMIPFAGFFSKDAILAGAFLSHHTTIWIIGIVTAMITAYYTFRIIYRTFHGPPADEHQVAHAHESPPVMMIPLTILAVLSLVGGWVGIPKLDIFSHFLESVLPVPAHEVSSTTEIVLVSVALAAAILGIFVARVLHLKRRDLAERLATQNPVTAPIHRLLERKYYVDEIYDALFVKPIYFISDKFLFRAIDVNIIDALVNDLALLLRATGKLFRKAQTGDARTYAAAILLGTLGLVIYFLWMVRG
jgi:NADH-quinone oxidoreductase subunit L